MFMDPSAAGHHVCEAADVDPAGTEDEKESVSANVNG